MFSSSEGRKSVDSLSSTAGMTHRPDFPFHRQSSKTRRESFASSINSIGGSLDTALGGGWTDSFYESGQNAISTLLQPPIVRTGLLPHTSPPPNSGHKPPTAKDIPPVALTNIAHIEASEFATYLSQVGALHEQLRRVKESEDEQQQAAAVSSPRRNSSKDDVRDMLMNDGHLRPGTKRTPSSRKLSISSVSSLSLNEATSPVRRSSPGFGKRGNQGPPPLTTIPTVYFDDNFHLENPRTFDIVSEKSEVVPASSTPTNSEKAGGNANNSNNGAAVAAPAPRKALATNAILQEKLSWYMDTVEMHLISSISTASTAFFAALGSLKELHTEAADSVDRIKSLRAELGALDDEIAIRGLDIVQKQRRRQNLQELHAAVVQLRDIVDDVGACETLVDEGEVDQALDGIDALEKFIAGEHDPKQDEGQRRQQRRRRRTYPLRDLRSATALEGVNDDINTLRFRIGKAYEAKFVAVLMKDVRRHTESVSSQEVLMRWNSASMRARGSHSRDPSAFPAYLASTDDLRSELLPILTGLHRARHIAAATQVYRDSVLREIRNLVRKPLPSSNDDDNESMMSSSTLGSSRHRSQQEKSSILARNLRALEPDDAESLLIRVYISVTETLRRLTTQVKVLLDVASSVGDDSSSSSSSEAGLLKSPPFSPSGRPMQPHLSSAGIEAQSELHKTLDVNNLLGQAVDVAQDKVVKLLRVRSDQSAHLSLVFFLRYFTLNLHFANECEAISGRSGTTLKTVVNGQIKEFVQNHGNIEKQKLAQGMERDQWAAKDFSDKDTVLLQQILRASTNDADEWTAEVRLWAPASTGDSDVDDDDDGTSALAAGNNSAGGRTKTRSAVIDAETFLLPYSAVLCLDGIARFMHLTVAVPFMTTDVATSLVQYLQLFNSRCTQLILGAGATRSAGLKNITTRHLAVASQALAFIAALVPYVREFVRRRAGSSGSGSSSGSGGGGGGGGSGTASGGPASSLMGEFDKIRRQYQEHQNSIFDKLVEIMSGRAAAHAKTMRGIDWDADDDSRPSTVHPYMETLVKETTTLHRNLAKALPDGTVRFIMASVFEGYTAQLGDALTEARVRKQTGQDSMLRDVECFQSRLGKIDGFDNAGQHLKDIVLAKAIVVQPAASPPAEQASAETAMAMPSTAVGTKKEEDEDEEEEGKKEKEEQREGKEDKEDEAETKTAGKPLSSSPEASDSGQPTNGAPEVASQDETTRDEGAKADNGASPASPAGPAKPAPDDASPAKADEGAAPKAHTTVDKEQPGKKAGTKHKRGKGKGGSAS
ncbi:Vps54-like protein [Niveomyces insectorum RCEF 264]|uniref:Vps54-like protein n=1 Tax=Niveomyces insectorum RCEF 264 TaxID=1081102 RepID=A0A167X1V7_9HYPO|nr:Vps54-like protein [Niveomyces insectorum RCEF 264]